MWSNEGIKDIINMQPYMGTWARPFKVWKHYLFDQLLNGNNIIHKLNNMLWINNKSNNTDSGKLTIPYVI
ncbi:MAG: hypothetical protein ACKESA_01320 [Candidatus Hodgkinia cicadicola]